MSSIKVTRKNIRILWREVSRCFCQADCVWTMWKCWLRATVMQFSQNQAQERFAVESASDLYFLGEEPPDPAHSNTDSPPPQRFVRRLKNLFFLHSPSFDPKRDVFVWRISFGLPLEKVSIPTTAVISILTFVFLGYYVDHLIHLTPPQSSVRRLENLFFLHSLSFDPRQRRVKVNFLARCGQKSDLSGLCGIGYWVWIISTAHCKQPILVGY